ncbi:MAG: transketolase [Bacteroidales bacterium]|nr:transketolase [Bacteroidales bacterium]MBN2758288.1 transketolase [Bacteroidales bacterium]
MGRVEELENIATQVRRDVIRMINLSQSGHPGGSLGCADLMTCLYFDILKYDPCDFDMDGKNQDVFFLSIGHIAPVWYSVLARSGSFDIKELKTLRKLDSKLQGHPSIQEKTEGVRIASGSLGQGLSVAAGAALAKKLNKDKSLVYSLHGDGEMQEGQIWEAATFAAHHKIDNLISVIDNNGKQIDGPVSEVMNLGNLKAKWEAFGWLVFEMDGNNIQDVLDTMKKAKDNTGNNKPIMIIMKTEMGMGVDFMMGTHKWHGAAPTDEQTKLALSQLPETLGDF